MKPFDLTDLTFDGIDRQAAPETLAGLRVAAPSLEDLARWCRPRSTSELARFPWLRRALPKALLP